MDDQTTIFLSGYAVGIALWFYYWWQACSYLKENNGLAFFNWLYLFLPDKFKPEGNKYRIKALILFVFVVVLIISNQQLGTK